MTVSDFSHHYDDEFDCIDLIKLFDQCFASNWNTRLVDGGQEPIYRPADSKVTYHQLVFTRDYFSSALHEIAHWCIAGRERRKRIDYGYWYAPDGRSSEQQYEFERVESRPQALEWIFTKACNRQFKMSIDNLYSTPECVMSFRQAIVRDALIYCGNGLPGRAELFYRSLANYYDVPENISALKFNIYEI